MNYILKDTPPRKQVIGRTGIGRVIRKKVVSSNLSDRAGAARARLEPEAGYVETSPTCYNYLLRNRTGGRGKAFFGAGLFSSESVPLP